MAQTELLPVDRLRTFAGHPYQVKDDEEMEQLTDSIKTHGVLTPVLVRPLENGNYEIISGHRRVHACKKAGIKAVPALICALDRDAAAVALVDSNLHRDHILPSERAFAYKLKMEALSHQGKRNDLTSTQVVSKLRTNELVGHEAGESREQIRRYIRLTNLIPEILQKVDNGEIAFTPAVELSYLKEPEQQTLLEAMEREDCTPSLSQAVQLKKLSQSGFLTAERIASIMEQLKANQQEKISFRVHDIRKYFPKGYDAAQIQQTILKLLDNYQKHRQRDQSR